MAIVRSAAYRFKALGRLFSKTLSRPLSYVRKLNNWAWGLLTVITTIVAAFVSGSTTAQLTIGIFLAWLAAIFAFAAVLTLIGKRKDARAQNQRPLSARRLSEPIAVCPGAGVLHVLERSRQRLCRVADGEIVEVRINIFGWGLAAPRGLVVGADGTIFIADAIRGQLVLPPDGGDPMFLKVVEDHEIVPVAIALDGDGNPIVADAHGGRILRAIPNKAVEVIATGLRGVRSMAVGPDQTIYVSDKFGHRVHGVTPSGTTTPIAGVGEPGFTGDEGPAHLARLRHPTGLAMSPQGCLHIADTGNHRIRMIDSNNRIATVAGSAHPGHSGNGGPATEAKLNFPTALAFQGHHLFVADTGNDRVRVIKPDQTIEAIAG